jgi:Icc-related predicted phosphoesterase
MKILAIADRPPSKRIKDILHEHSDISLICTLGDLDYFDLIELADIQHIPKIGVYGNHDSGTYFENLGIINLHLKTFQFGGYTFGGFQGSVRYKENPYAIMYTQEEAFELLKDFPYVDVMIAHCPPYGINDEPEELAHQGFKALREYIETKKPKYFFHGHTYPREEKLITKFCETQIIYVYGEKIVEIQ